MLKQLLLATLCVAVLANGPQGRQRQQGQRPGGRAQGQRPGDRGQGRTRPVAGVQEDNTNLPQVLPNIMSIQLQDLFERMQIQQDANQALDLKQWNDTIQQTVQTWWTTISERLGKGQTFPDDVSTSLGQAITKIFAQMQNEVNNGRALDFNQWYSEMAERAQAAWQDFVDGTDSTTRRDRPQSGKRQGGSRNQVDERPQRPNQVPQGRRPPPQRPQIPRRTLPDNLPEPMKEQLTAIFDGMQEELDTGNDLALTDWHDQTQTTFQGWWDRMQNRLTAQGAQSPQGRRTFPEELPSKMQDNIKGVFDGIQEELDAGQELDLAEWGNQMADHAEGWWDRYTRLLGNGPDNRRDLPNNLPPKMKQDLKEVFDNLQKEIASGNDFDLEEWHNKTQTVLEGWWERMTNIVGRKNPRVEDKPFFQDTPTKWQEEITDLFARMQVQLDNAQPLDVKEWYKEISKSAEKWWNAYSRKVEPGRPSTPRKNYPDAMPDKWTGPVNDVFDRMQTQVENNGTLELTPYHDEVQDIAETWWSRMSKMVKASKGRGQPSPKKGKKTLPVDMRQQITDVFRRMGEETVADQWEIDFWRNETLELIQEWWERLTNFITNEDLEIIPQNWTASLQEIHQRIVELVTSVNTLDISQWREEAVNASRTWLDFSPVIARRLGYRTKGDQKYLERLGERIPQHVSHLFDRMELQAMDGIPINTTEWEMELEELAESWGRRILSKNNRDQGRDRNPSVGRRPSSGKPQGRPQDRPTGRPQGRPQDRPNGRPQGRPDNRNDRPNKQPQGKPQDRPNGKPNSRPRDRTNGSRPNNGKHQGGRRGQQPRSKSGNGRPLAL